MWIQLNNATFSIVEHRNMPDLLQVRARFKGDIEKVFGVNNGLVLVTPDADYMYRIFVPREDVARVIANQVQNIDYTNFKDSVTEHWRKAVYSEVWTKLAAEQDRQHPGTGWWYNYRNQSPTRNVYYQEDDDENEYAPTNHLVESDDVEEITAYASEEYVDHKIEEIYEYIDVLAERLLEKINEEKEIENV